MSSEAVPSRQRIAVVGAGISGLTAAWLLGLRHEVTVFEAEPRLGGHTFTVDVAEGAITRAIDTGFIVFNDLTYPNFRRILKLLGVGSKPTTMSFSMHCERTRLEYNGGNLGQIFAQRSNLFSPGFWGMLRDIMRFHDKAHLALQETADPTIGDFAREHRLGRRFVDHYLVPMGAAIWSSEPEAVLAMPARFFVQFFANHGMLQVTDRPQWYVVEGGSRSYVHKFAALLGSRVRTGTPIRSVQRDAAGVTLTTGDGRTERFDAVVLATHSDTSLRMLADPTAAERAVLGAIPYQENEAVLHTDTRLLPDRRKAWAAWNYRIPQQARSRVAVTYCMNLLQGIDGPVTYNVTLNQSDAVDPAKVLRRITWHHPIYSREGVAAQARWREVSGVNRTHYAGAWTRYGFHEDGVLSGLRVAQDFGLSLDDAERAIAKG